MTKAKPGKTVARRTYIHVSGLDLLEETALAQVAAAEQTARAVRGEQFNVVRFEDGSQKLALLHYPGFFEDAFPALRESWSIDLGGGRSTYRTYEDSLNPPILHRKELLLPDGHPNQAEYAALTESAESIGLFDDPVRIGFREQWERLVRERGYRMVGHQLVPIGNDESVEEESPQASSVVTVSRHLTALVRYGFSAPVQTLARYGFLDGRYTVFDYGCGRGDDMRGLGENGVQVGGWDPHYAPDNSIAPAHVVNLGFVINVIEDFHERVDALRRAYSLAEQVLVVAVMLANQNAIEGQRYNDGVLTRRGTFQKYYTQAELKAFLEEVLDEEPIAVGPGIFYVFRDKDTVQRFLADRVRSRWSLLRRPSRPAVERAPRERRERAEEKYQAYREPLDRLWEQWLALGREPDKAEVADLLALTEGFGSLGKALRFVAARNNAAGLEAARQARVADLEVYFALNQFERRKPYKQLEPGLQRAIKAFFGDYATAQQAARELLFRIASPEAIDAACRQAAEHGLGWLIEGESLQLHVSLVERLPPLLRVYFGCASVLYGDYRISDLVKVHVRSGKLTLIRFDDFGGQPLPRMVERVKIKLRQHDFDYFGYGEEYEPPFLYHKSRYINEEFSNYPEQVAFDEALDKLDFIDLSGYGPKPAEFLNTLENHRWAIDGFKLVRSRTIPDIDASCGRYFKFRDLIECGETQARTGLPNLPYEPETYNALYDLAANILDPVIDYFGMIKLTYGFCSPEIAKYIKSRVAPTLDQHAAHERKRNGDNVCDRLGAAADFVVDDEDMLQVAEWIIDNLPYDRLYYYGPNRPIHVSFSPNGARVFVRLQVSASGRLVPKLETKRGSAASRFRT